MKLQFIFNRIIQNYNDRNNEREPKARNIPVSRMKPQIVHHLELFVTMFLFSLKFSFFLFRYRSKSQKINR